MLRLALPPSARNEESITVAQAAVILGCDQATVRALIRCEAIEGHRIGKTDDNPTGVRANLQSVLNYKARHAIRSTEPPPKVKPARRRRREASASYREAMVALRAMGSRV